MLHMMMMRECYGFADEEVDGEDGSDGIAMCCVRSAELRNFEDAIPIGPGCSRAL
jgi:hypothetical protein